MHQLVHKRLDASWPRTTEVFPDPTWWNGDAVMDTDPTGECDCCGRMRPLSRCWAGALETWACDECRGWDDEDQEPDDPDDWESEADE